MDLFQSTQPSQAVTNWTLHNQCKKHISIHTALAGCDLTKLAVYPILSLFQSTQPSQAVTWKNAYNITLDGFQSTQPSQAVTNPMTTLRDALGISIHTALAGCDPEWNQPGRGNGISIHTALAGCDGCG